MITMLSKRDWMDHDSPTENLPEDMTKPDTRLLILRENMVSARNADEFKLCNQQ